VLPFRLELDFNVSDAVIVVKVSSEGCRLKCKLLSYLRSCEAHVVSQTVKITITISCLSGPENHMRS
jgi:hypothetical protein